MHGRTHHHAVRAAHRSARTTLSRSSVMPPRVSLSAGYLLLLPPVGSSGVGKNFSGHLCRFLLLPGVRGAGWLLSRGGTSRNNNKNLLHPLTFYLYFILHTLHFILYTLYLLFPTLTRRWHAGRSLWARCAEKEEKHPVLPMPGASRTPSRSLTSAAPVVKMSQSQQKSAFFSLEAGLWPTD